jgi:hypothetical protein
VVVVVVVVEEEEVNQMRMLQTLYGQIESRF